MNNPLLNWLTQSLFVISTILLVPVILLLLGQLVTVLLWLGGFLREWRERRSLRDKMKQLVRDAGSDSPDPDRLWRALTRVGCGLPQRLVDDCGSELPGAALLKKGLADLEADVTAALARLSLVTRLAPMLGLMGTLIPLGPALMALAQGQLDSLSRDLIIAFTTTVVGLLVSCLAYAMGLARRVWYLRDVDDLEFLVTRITEKEACHDSSDEEEEVGLSRV